MPELKLGNKKIYKMPNNIFVKYIEGQYLVISVDTANWLLLNNEKQLEIYEFLSNNHTIEELLNTFSCEYMEDIIYVLTELEAKHFENLNINYPQEHGMYVYLTNKCNQRCNHCYMYAGETLEKELSTKEINKLLKEFSLAKGEVVTFTGGEATTRSDFIEIVSYAKKIGLKVCVLTNGLLWDESFINKTKQFIDEVQISIDGYNSETYKEVRNMDTFDTALKSVERLIYNDVKVIVAISPLLSSIIDNQKEYIDFAKNLTNKYKDYDFVVKFNSELLEGRNISPNKADNEKYKQASKNIKKSCRKLSEQYEFALNHRNNTIFNNCGYGGLSISAEGDVYFCNLISKCSKQANIRTHSFSKISDLSKLARQSSDVNNLLPCKNCDLKYLCGGGCRVKHFPNLISINFEEKNKNTKDIERKLSCSKEYKNKIYKLMIDSNKLFYRKA